MAGRPGLPPTRTRRWPWAQRSKASGRPTPGVNHSHARPRPQADGGNDTPKTPDAHRNRFFLRVGNTLSEETPTAAANLRTSFFSRRLVLSPPLFAYQPAFFSFLLYLRVCWRVWSCTTSAGSLATRSRYAARRRRSVVPGSPRTHSTGTLSLTGTTRRPSVLPRASCRRFSQPLAAEPNRGASGDT